ncbi:regulatory phage cox family protein [Aeromonas caviae]|uniref:Cro/Cl family transcriptional regulator n=1 Tax=Aeromonas TaxID=642 RepID=UPI001B341FC8|nr:MULTISPECIES: Cro/Cl family transcriptional regulator [Aeromonas]MBP4058653.1 Cro/Cl family transcriptional regulator [Aeromonas sp. Prich7-2]MDH0316213.1 regulatory phage cox family protein [Aeromonas caviae]
MTPSIAVYTFPVCSKEKFAELAGFTEDLVQTMIEDGRLPILPKTGLRQKVLINLEALRLQCQASALVSR